MVLRSGVGVPDLAEFNLVSLTPHNIGFDVVKSILAENQEDNNFIII